MPTEKNIKTPELLYKHFQSYQTDCKNNPKFENFYSAKSDKQVSIEREVPYTWLGFEVWLRKNKILAKLEDYKADKDKRYSEYADIIRAIDAEIVNDKMDGAFAGIYQHNIVARDLGLTDKVQSDVRTTELPATEEEIDAQLKELEKKHAEDQE